MRLVYDHQIFVFQEYGGISRYICELADHVAMIDGFDVEILAPLHLNHYLRDCSHARVTGKYIRSVPKTVGLRQKISDLIVKRRLHKDPPDVLHETYYFTSRLSPKKTKIVTTIHDMIPEKFGEAHSAYDKITSAKAVAVNRADHIVCISDNTRKDLIELLNVDPQKISVIHHGHSFKVHGACQDEKRIVAKPYILYVGLRTSYYKNFKRLLQSYATSVHITKQFSLVCFGGGCFNTDEISEMKRLNILENVVQLSGDDNSLANLYSHASAFVYPSLYEGFGIPLLEAMSYRCPVICSNCSSFPEVAGDAAEYFDPFSIENIAYALERILMSPERSETLIARGEKRVQQFSWEKCADQTRLVYSSLC